MADKKHAASRKFFLKMLLSSLLRRKARMGSALLALTLGAALLSGLAEVVIDLPHRMRTEFRSYGANLVFVPGGGTSTFSESDLEKARALLPAESLLGLTPYRFKQCKINEQPFMAAGADMAQIKKTSPYWAVQGRWPQESGEALLGRAAADTLLLAPGRAFTITGSTFSGDKMEEDFVVSGIVETGGKEEAFVFLPLTSFNSLTGGGGVYDSAECSIALDAKELEALSAAINAVCVELRARPVKRLADSENAVLGKLSALIFLVSVVVLVLIMICVGTTMMAAAAERRKEIALRKALGALPKSLLAEFAGEGILLGLTGGLAGSALGFAFARFVGLRVFGLAPGFNPLIFAASPLVLVCVTLLAQALPVRAAARIEPAVVLKGE